LHEPELLKKGKIWIVKKNRGGGMQFKFISLSDPYYRDELMLRWEAIEKPKGLPPGSERFHEEKESFHLVAIEKKQLVGCIVCYPQSETEGKIFHLAFSEEYKGKPFSRQMLSTLEEFLMDKGISHLHVVAGMEMKDFYSHLGFSVEEEPFESYGTVFQKMGKTLLASA
jgi:N-acetylglutamate synthase-like GNAT family acetyltransferase